VQSAQLYRDLGLNEREIELLAAATPKKQVLSALAPVGYTGSGK